jgi:hypothetical protein
MTTKDKGLILRPDVSRSFEVHADCNFAGNWVQEDAMADPSTAKSRTGYIISYGGCPVIWASKLQTEVVLSSTKSEYVGLSESLRVAIVMMNLLNEMKALGITISKTTPTVFCKLFEDNAGAIHLAKVPKMRPRTRHINQKYHHFREWVKFGVDRRSTNRHSRATSRLVDETTQLIFIRQVSPSHYEMVGLRYSSHQLLPEGV